MAWISRNDLDRWFSYQAPDYQDVSRIREIREAARRFADVIHANTPGSADQSAAIRLVREAMMTANAAIVCRRREGDQIPGESVSSSEVIGSGS